MYNPNNWYNYNENQTYNIVYLTTNIVNNKIYVGVHKTDDINDKYLGSGTHILKAIKKYGRDKFKRIVLHYCLTPEQALEIENKIVDLYFIKRKDTYNIDFGGRGGITKSEHHITSFKNAIKNRTIEKKLEIKQKMSDKVKNSPKAMQHIKNITKSYHNADNGMAAKFLFICPNKQKFIVHGNLLEFIKNHNLSIHYVRKFSDKGVIQLTKKQCNGSIRCYNLNGWEIITLQKPKNKGVKKTSDQKEKQKMYRKNQKSPSGKIFTLTNPNGEVFVINSGLLKFTKNNLLSISMLRRNINKGTIKNIGNRETNLALNTLGWSIESKDIYYM